MDNEAEFQKRLLATFRTEAQEHLGMLSTGLIELEKAQPEQHAGIIESVFREAHSLKGAARSVNLTDVVHVCQAMEDAFSALKRKEILPSPPLLDLLHQAVSRAGRLVAGEELSESERSEVREIARKLEEAAVVEKLESATAEAGDTEPEMSQPPEQDTPHPPSTTAAPAHPSQVSAPALGETVRTSVAKLNSILLQAEELLTVKLATGQRASELKGIIKTIATWTKERAKAVTQGSYQEQVKLQSPNPVPHSLASHPTIEQFIASIESRLTALLKTAEYDHRSFGLMVDNLLDYVKKSLMLPLSSLTEMFPKYVRDLSREMGKQVEFVSSGEEIEIDRRILEEIKDPLIHLVRNCIDHGIETPEERGLKKKNPQGRLEIGVLSRDSKIEISVRDDGAGIDVSKIKSSAVKQGLMTQEEAGKLGEQEALSLVFRSGVTTSPIITDISGRGLGLAIVQEKLEKLNGTVTLESHPGEGTTCRLVAPLTLATFRGTLIRVGEHLFVLPSINIERVARVKKENVMTVENRETLSLNGEAISLSRLNAVLELRTNVSRQQSADPYIQIAVLAAAGKRIAFLVDEILQEQEVLVKPLGKQLPRVRNVAGATVFGSGKVVPILNVADLMKSAVKVAGAPAEHAVEEAREKEKRSVLVVEDSITTRILLKNILDSAGYDVTTAVDGVDAFTRLKSGRFDIVVTDVDMPRMNGFELTAKLRSDKELGKLPVVLVTALESREDRERGIDVGANAYIVKSSFDQSNLLEVIKRIL